MARPFFEVSHLMILQGWTHQGNGEANQWYPKSCQLLTPPEVNTTEGSQADAVKQTGSTLIYKEAFWINFGVIILVIPFVLYNLNKFLFRIWLCFIINVSDLFFKILGQSFRCMLPGLYLKSTSGILSSRTKTGMQRNRPHSLLSSSSFNLNTLLRTCLRYS